MKRTRAANNNNNNNPEDKKKPNKLPKISQQVDPNEKLFEDPYELISRRPEKICSLEDHKRKKNCKGNPWCCYGLGEFKEGIWAQYPSIFRLLGPDLTKQLRKTPSAAAVPLPSSLRIEEEIQEINVNDTYGGLKNLGATCYMNVFLQTMYHNLMFRDFIYSFTEEKIQKIVDPSLQQMIEGLQYVFYSLETNRCLVIDPKQFVDVTGVSYYIQQDPQEFQNLLFSKLESSQTNTKNSPFTSSESSTSSGSVGEGYGTVKWIFSGKEKHTIVCLECHRQRSSEIEFNELSLSIDKDTTLDDALQGSLHSSEMLGDDNKLECGYCKKNTRSERQIDIINYPPVLCIHLLRYQYNRSTANKMKTRFELSYPPVLKIPSLNVATDVQTQSSKKKMIASAGVLLEYVLISVVFHLGKSAHGGHYVSDIYDWERSQWIHCDDELIIPNLAHDVVFPSDEKHHEEEESETKNTAQSKNVAKKGKKKLNPTKEELITILTDEEGEYNNDDYDEATTVTISDFEEEEKAKKSKNTKRKPTNKNNKRREVIDLGEEEELIQEQTSGKKKKAGKKETRKSSSVNSDTSSRFQRKRDSYILYYIQREYLNKVKMMNREKFQNSKLVEKVQIQSTLFTNQVQEYINNRHNLEMEIASRKEQVQSLLSTELPDEMNIIPSADDKSFHILPVEWLKKWVIGDETTFECWRQLKQKRSILPTTDAVSKEKTEENEELVPIVLDDETEMLRESAPKGVDAVKEEEEVVIVEEENGKGKKKGKTSLIQNKDRTCAHGCLNINAVDEIKIISNFAFERIFSLPSSSTDNVDDSGESYFSSFLLENLDYDINQDNYRCSICYDQIVTKRQQIRQEIDILQQILFKISDLSPKTTIRDPYYLSNQAFQLLKRYLGRLEKQQQSNKIFDGSLTDQKQVEMSSSEQQLVDLIQKQPKLKKATPQKVTQEQTLDSFLVDTTTLTKNENGGTTTKKEDVLSVRQDIFGDGYLLNGNLLCEAHGQPILDIEKKAIQINADIWQLILQLFPIAKSIRKNHDTTCFHCKKKIEDVHNKNEEIKAMKCAELNDEVLQSLHKKRGNKSSSSSSSSSEKSGSVIYPQEFAVWKQLTVHDDLENIEQAQFYLIDKDWLTSWRSYMSSHSSSSSVKEIQKPSLFTNEKLRCKHNLLTVNLHVVKECCSDQDYDELIRSYMYEQAIKLPENLFALPFTEIKQIPSLPDVEILTLDQWKKLVYYHYTYPMCNQRGSGSGDDGDEDEEENTEKTREELDDQMIIDITKSITPNNSILPVINEQKSSSSISTKNAEVFTAKLEPTVITLSKSSFQNMKWSISPSICLDCTSHAIEQYYLKQLFYESEGMTTFIIKDPVLMQQFLQTVQSDEEKDAPNGVFIPDPNEIETLLQNLAESIDTNNEDETSSSHMIEPVLRGRRETRSRSSSKRKKYRKGNLWVSSQDNIGIIKLKILESFDIPFSSQQLYCARSTTTTTDPSLPMIELTQGNKTLQDYSILARDILFIVDLRNQENGNDPANGTDFDFLHEFSASTNQKPEAGFTGTIFASSAAVNNASKEKSIGKEKEPEIIELMNEDSQSSVLIVSDHIKERGVSEKSHEDPPPNNKEETTTRKRRPSDDNASNKPKNEGTTTTGKKRTRKNAANTRTIAQNKETDTTDEEDNNKNHNISLKNHRKYDNSKNDVQGEDMDEDFLRAIEESKKDF